MGADLIGIGSGDKKKANRARWNESKKAYFVKLLCDYNIPRYRAQNGWNKEAWNKILHDMNVRYPLDNFQIRQIKDLEQNLKKQFKTVKELSEYSGFGWDCENNLVIAPDEVWQSIFERDPNAKKWYKQPFPYFDALFNLYEGKYANGLHSRAGGITSSPDPSTSSMPQSPMPSIPTPGESSIRFGFEENVEEYDIDSTNPFFSQVPSQIQETQYDEVQRVQQQVPTRQASSPIMSDNMQSKKSKRNRAAKMNFGDQYPEFRREESQLFFAAMEKQRAGPSESYSMTDCIHVFNELQGFAQEDLFKAIKVFNDKVNREVFLAQ